LVKLHPNLCEFNLKNNSKKYREAKNFEIKKNDHSSETYTHKDQSREVKFKTQSNMGSSIINL